MPYKIYNSILLGKQRENVETELWKHSETFMLWNIRIYNKNDLLTFLFSIKKHAITRKWKYFIICMTVRILIYNVIHLSICVYCIKYI